MKKCLAQSLSSALAALVVSLLLWLFSPLASSITAQGFNVASTYHISDPATTSGDIIISSPDKGLTRTDVSYDNRLFGVVQESPLILVSSSAEPSASEKPVIREGDVVVNVTDYNGQIRRSDFVTSSPALGKGMRSGQSGYVLGVALDDAVFTSDTISVGGRAARVGTVRVGLRIEYAELNTARNSIHLLDDLNAALFHNLKDPEKFVNAVRAVVAGLIAVVAFAIGFYSINRSLLKSVEAVGRNPLAKVSILSTMGVQIGVVIIGALFTVFVIYLLLRY